MLLSECKNQIEKSIEKFGDIDVKFYKYDDIACECFETDLNLEDISKEDDKYIIIL